MIIGIGTDIISLARIKSGLNKFGSKIINKILSPEEKIAFASTSNPVQFLGSRFSAKEAFVKALGTGMRNGLWFTQITIASDKMGKPVVLCAGKAAELLLLKKINKIEISLSHEKEYAIAFVILCGKS